VPDRPPCYQPFPAPAPSSQGQRSAHAPTKRSDPFYHTARWKRCARLYLASNPVCVISGPRCTVRATVADHVTPRRELPEERWLSWDELQACCAACHNAKTKKGR